MAPEPRTKQPLKILVISHGMELGGIERSLIGLLGPLADLGHAVDLLLFNHDGELMPLLDPRVRLLPEDPVLSNLKTQMADVLKTGLFQLALVRLAAKMKASIAMRAGRSPVQFAYVSRWAQRLVKDVPRTYDVALSFQGPHDFVLRHVDARLKVGWVHTDYTSEHLDPDFEGPIWSGLDQVAAVSDSAKDAFTEILPTLRSRTFVVENSFDPAFVRKQALETPQALLKARASTAPLLCTAGRFSHAKGFDIAVEACAILAKGGTPIRWLAVGYGPEEEALRIRIREHGLEDTFIIVGKQANPYPFMAAADLYVQPSRFEGKAVAVREAQTLGKPVLITNYPTAASQLSDGVDGMVCGQSPEEIATAIIRLLTNAELRTRIAKQAAESDYSNRDAVFGLMIHLQAILEAS